MNASTRDPATREDPETSPSEATPSSESPSTMRSAPPPSADAALDDLLADDPSEVLAGDVIAGRYLVDHLVGRGGMGSVWAGRHQSLDQTVAIKFINPELGRSELARRRFDTEARAAARLRSRHAVTVHDHGITERGQPYIVMEYLEGESLEARVARKGALPLPEVIEIIRQASRALAVAHEQGIIHRDLKPENIFLANDREAAQLGYTVKIVDFGIAKMVHEEGAEKTRDSATQAGTIVGTPHFMAPETLTDNQAVGPGSDIWSLGACAYVAAVGKMPFDGDAIGEVVLNVCASPMPVPSASHPSLPKEFDAWFARACHRDRSLRFQSVVEMVEALGSLTHWAAAEREKDTFELRTATPPEDLLIPDPPRQNYRGFIVLGVVACVLLGAGVVVYSRVEAANEAIAAAEASARQMREQAEAELAAARASSRASASARPIASTSASAAPSATPKGP